MTQEIQQQASRFAAMEREGHVLENEPIFKAWLEADERHQKAFEAEKALVAAVRGLPAAFLEELKCEIHENKPRKPANAPLMGPLAVSLVAACLVLVLGVGFLMDKATFSHAYVAGEKVASAIFLPDETTVALDAGTDMEVTYYKAKRTVRLSRGKAMFNVVSNPENPFIILMEGAQVRVLGTRFEVVNHDDFLLVSVLEGKVEVLRGEKPFSVVEKGQRLRLDYGTWQGYMQAIDPKGVARWDEGKYTFTQANLDEVFAAFSKHLDIEVVFEKEYLAFLPINANIDVARFEDFLHVLPLIHAVSVERNAQTVHIKQPSSKK